MPHRFFIPPEWITPPTVTMRGDVARQLKTVLRMRPGDEIVVLDNTGAAWRVELTHLDKGAVTGRLVDEQPAGGEPKLHITLYQGALKAQKFEWVLQKGVELGVSRFVPTLCRRAVIRHQADLLKKYARWQQIIKEAAEQSRRGKLPELTPPQPLAEAVSRADGLKLILWEEAGQTSLKTAVTGQALNQVSIFIGPEGGFTSAEVEIAKKAGAQPVTLGPRILRAETAGLAVCAALMYATGEWE